MRLALFDLDNTLLTGDCDYEWVRFLLERGELERPSRDENEEVARRESLGEISPEEYARFYLAPLKGREPAQLETWHHDFMRERIVPNIPEQALKLLAQHREEGDLVVLTTATSRFHAQPAANYLAIEHVIATEPESVDGCFTGNFIGLPNMCEGKVRRLDAWLAERGYNWLDFAETWFYSDSLNDIPLLNRVSRPVAVDPDDALAAHAHARGWPVLRLRREPA